MSELKNVYHNCYYVNNEFIFLSESMKKFNIIDESLSSPSDSDYITLGDITFIFARKLKEYHSLRHYLDTVPYFTCTHEGDIRQIYKTLLYAYSCRTKARSKKDGRSEKQNIKYIDELTYKISTEIELIYNLDLLDDLIEFSKKVTHRFEFDEDYKKVDSTEGNFVDMPFFCIKGMKSTCDFDDLVLFLMLTYKKYQSGLITQKVLDKTFGLVYNESKSLYNTFYFEKIYNTINEKLKLNISSSDFVNEMDQKYYIFTANIYCKGPSKEDINKFIEEDRFYNSPYYEFRRVLEKPEEEDFERVKLAIKLSKR